MQSQLIVIEPPKRWMPLDLSEIWAYRDLFRFLVWRDIKARYAQSVLGIGWAVVQPLFTMIVFTIVFGRLAGVPSDNVAYSVFSLTALVPWTYFASAVTASVSSLSSSSALLTKVYVPRLILPMAPVASKLVDFGISLLILIPMLIWYRQVPTLEVLYLPLLVLMMILAASGFGMWLSAIAVQYRDVNYAMTFAMQLFMYAAPVVYPASAIPARFRLVYGLNPMAGVIEGFRSALLGTQPMPWDLILPGAAVTALLFVSGAYYFRRTERIFADVV